MGPRQRAHALIRTEGRTRLRRFQAAHRFARAGRSGGPPDFVGIGAQRCGTSWWHALIEQHPRVTGLGLGAKELHYFDDKWDETPAAMADDYAAQFLRRPGQLAGEWTPRYMFDPWAVPMLAEMAPQVKLLVLLRDPVARFESGVRHLLRDRRQLTADTIHEAFSRGLYAQQLEPVLDAVPREQILVLQFEQCIREPAANLRRTLDFLHLEPCDLTPDRSKRNTGVDGAAVPASLVQSVKRAYRADSDRLQTMFPRSIDLEHWGRLH